jgi:hypothetical protein
MMNSNMEFYMSQGGRRRSLHPQALSICNAWSYGALWNSDSSNVSHGIRPDRRTSTSFFLWCEDEGLYRPPATTVWINEAGLLDLWQISGHLFSGMASQHHFIRSRRESLIDLWDGHDAQPQPFWNRSFWFRTFVWLFFQGIAPKRTQECTMIQLGFHTYSLWHIAEQTSNLVGIHMHALPERIKSKSFLFHFLEAHVIWFPGRVRPHYYREGASCHFHPNQQHDPLKPTQDCRIFQNAEIFEAGAVEALLLCVSSPFEACNFQSMQVVSRGWEVFFSCIGYTSIP